MGYDARGKVYIPLDELFKLVAKYLPCTHDYLQLNLDHMKVLVGNDELEIEYAASSECDPADWATPPEWITKKKG